MDRGSASTGHLKALPHRVFQGLPSERLEAALIDAQARLDKAAEDGADSSRVKICQERLDSARRAAQRRFLYLALPREYLAWDCLAQFEREMVYLMSPGQLRALWMSLKSEAEEKLSRHRKQAVADMVKSVEVPGRKHARSEPTADTVAEVFKQVHISSQNRYYKLGQLRKQIAYAGLFLFVLIFGLLMVASFEAFAGMSDNFDVVVRRGILLGLTGGVLSLAFSVVRTDVNAKIPNIRMSFEVAAIRPLIGAALAVPVILIFESGWITVSGVEKEYLIAIACFLAGFSERWFLGLMETLEGKTANDNKRRSAGT